MVEQDGMMSRAIVSMPKRVKCGCEGSLMKKKVKAVVREKMKEAVEPIDTLKKLVKKLVEQEARK